MLRITLLKLLKFWTLVAVINSRFNFEFLLFNSSIPKDQIAMLYVDLCLIIGYNILYVRANIKKAQNTSALI